MAPWTGPLSLRERILVVFVCATLVPFMLTVGVSWAAISSIQTNQIQSRIRANLAEVALSIENALDNLNHVSQQLAFQGSVGSRLDQFLSTQDGFERATIRDQIKTELTLVSYTNPNVGLMLYTFGNGTSYDFETSPNVVFEGMKSLPPLVRRNQISYFGPHKSLDRFNGRTVLSVLRKVDSNASQEVSLYLETAFKLTEKLLTSAKTHFLFLDGNRRTVYSEVPAVFPVGSVSAAPVQGFAARGGYLWNETSSKQGWTLVSVVLASDYNQERDEWLGTIGILAVVFLIISVLLATLLWRTVYRPLGVFQREMTWIETRNQGSQVMPVNIPEFDRLLFQFQDMKDKVVRLIDEERDHERRRADLEIEKLRYQINPHFLLNALHTVHWLAVVHHQPEIDSFALSLTKLLNYNLGKLGNLGTIRDEIDALREYVAIQSLRFDLKFTSRILVDEATLDTLLPRFTLQPLIENAIQHGLGDDGWIELEVSRQADGIHISIEDHGPGVSADEAPIGMGIGLAYVRKALNFHFDHRARLEMTSGAAGGTRVTVILPDPQEAAPC